jgi:hypothetical protein
VANNTNASINNTIDVSANSGDATVANNTNGGNATTGNAQAVVNLMNLINSTVATGHSFVGTVNINGDLNGDILLPPGVLDALLASTGPSSGNAVATSLTDNSTTINNVAMATANNITADATTGNANVSNNTNAGSATSGGAHSNVTLLNLTGSNTVGKDALLVFVNVLGRWVGMIMNAPTGSTAAELGGGITATGAASGTPSAVASGTGPGSTNSSATNVTDNSHLTNTASLAITNTVNVHAHSGDATVADNTTGGNATSGNASTAVNILNMQGSNLSLTDWFGILFINVFGVWNGSFGINTSAGDPIVPPLGVTDSSSAAGSATTTNPVQAATQAAAAANFHRFASFAARSGGTGSPSNSAGQNASRPTGITTSASTDGSNAAGFQPAAILGSATSSHAQNNAHKASKSHANLFLPTVGFVLALLILIAGERDRLFHRHHK